MELVSDYIHPTPHGGRCRIRIYTDGDDLPVVICTEAEDNPGQSITNTAEQIAGEVPTNHPDLFASGSRGSQEKPFGWIEHYLDGARGPSQDRATFELVEFANYEPRDTLRAGVWTRAIGEPSWSPLDRETVETLVGERVD
jgi:hypothetical protein